MTTLVTGATGYLGSYIVDRLLGSYDERLVVLVRAKSRADGEDKLYRALQLHMDEARFSRALRRIDIVHGDLVEPGLGLSDLDRARIVKNVGSILHVAASLNRKSEKDCLNVNLRGTLAVLELARQIANGHGLRRFGIVSTAAVAGRRRREIVGEDDALEWSRSDYDPYARTKKFCEHMTRELLRGLPITIYRPATVMGDSRFPRTTQFDMVRATSVLAELPAVPIAATTRQDIVNADFVGRAIAELHMKDKPRHDIYHLSAGASSKTTIAIADVVARALGRRPPKFLPALERPFEAAVDGLASLRTRNTATYVGSLLKVFLPYVTNDVVFDNERVTSELGIEPVPFTEYGGPLVAWARAMGFTYPHVRRTRAGHAEVTA